MSVYRTDNQGKLIKVAGNVSADNLTLLEQLIISKTQHKVDKVEGKGLSTNDYTTAEKNKLAGIATGANKITVDSSLSTSSSNPIANSTVASKINAINTEISNLKTADTTNKNSLQTSINNLSSQLTTLSNTVNGLLSKAYPVGSVYISVNNTNPNTLFGFGTWAALPNGYALWTSTTTVTSESEGKDSGSTVYRQIPAGLPNITGTWGSKWNNHVRGFHDATASGAFYIQTDTSMPGRITSEDGSANNSSHNGYPWLDASRSNSIYGNSTTVQPKAYRIFAWKRTA